MTLPEQHSPPVYGCAAGAVLHGHAGRTLEPAVLLHTFLPPSVADRLHGPDVRVDVHADSPRSSTVTVRVLADDQSLSWSLPIAPFVAALPGQPGDDGRMVLLAVVDAEPEQGFWAEPVDCERLAGELQLPVADLAEALSGRLTPWLAGDLDTLLHDDAHDRAADSSPAQVVADAVLAHYRGDLAADQASRKLLRSLELAPDAFRAEAAGRLCAALAVAVREAGPAAVAQAVGRTGPFETEELRLLTELPPLLGPVRSTSDTDSALQLLVDAPDRDEAVRAAVAVTARLTRTAFGPDLPAEEVLQRLDMEDDAALARLARLWVDLAAAAAAAPTGDAAVAADVVSRARAEAAPGARWLGTTAAALARTALELAGRQTDRVAAPLKAVAALIEAPDPAADAVAVPAVRACIELARWVRSRGGVGPGSWLQVPPPAAARVVGEALLEGLDRTVAVDLLVELLEADVEAPELLDALVCATAQLLVHVDPAAPDGVRAVQVGELLQAVPGGPRGARWLLAACVREAPAHDPAAADLSAHLPRDAVDPDRAADRLGRHGLLLAGLDCLEALAAVLGEEAQMPREELLGMVLPAALAEHELLRP